jgi:predicted dehydrogenase
VGLGSIAEVFMRALSRSSNIRLTGQGTGHPERKGKNFAAQYVVPATSIYTYDTFDHIRDNRDIDAVYIALPNSMHCQYTVCAAEVGKHVFCEKPMAISSAQCRRMIDAGRQPRVKLMIGYRVHYDPTFRKLFDLVIPVRLEKFRSFAAAFTECATSKSSGSTDCSPMAGHFSTFDCIH